MKKQERCFWFWFFLGGGEGPNGSNLWGVLGQTGQLYSMKSE